MTDMTQDETHGLIAVDELPFITAGMRGIGGRIKAEPSHFSVEEIPLYDPLGEGEHVYVRLTREGYTTQQIESRLASLFDLRASDVGSAGRKDKWARTTQTFSLLLHNIEPERVAQIVTQNLDVDVLWARRHRNKLKPGHLLGNRFRTLVTDVVSEEESDLETRLSSIQATLSRRGLPNYYGAQRFGADGANAVRGREALLGHGPRKRWLRRLFLSAYQAALFNTWLATRIDENGFERLLTGDIAKKTDTGGLFEVEDAEAEMQRLMRGEITYTGPIYGARLWWATGAAGALERDVLQRAGVSETMLAQARLKGSRRPARLQIDDLVVTIQRAGVQFDFSLPKGAYATVVLREFMKHPAEAPHDG